MKSNEKKHNHTVGLFPKIQ